MNIYSTQTHTYQSFEYMILVNNNRLGDIHKCIIITDLPAHLSKKDMNTDDLFDSFPPDRHYDDTKRKGCQFVNKRAFGIILNLC